MRRCSQDLDPEILRDRYAIKVKDLTSSRARQWQLVKAIPGIGGISAYEELAGGFITVRNIATVVCLTLIASAVRGVHVHHFQHHQAHHL